jgi:hypothetical protein
MLLWVNFPPKFKGQISGPLFLHPVGNAKALIKRKTILISRMDATDIAIGIVLIGLLAWASMIALNQSSIRAEVAGLYVLSKINRTLVSPQGLCKSASNFELVFPSELEMQPYYVTAGVTDLNQTYFCFYRQLAEKQG